MKNNQARFARPCCLALFAAALAAAGCAATPPAPGAAPPAGTAFAAAPALAAAPGQAIPLVNADFESDNADPNGDPEGWYTGQHAGETSYVFTVDSAAKHRGTRSLRIDSVGREPFGSIAQVVPGRELGGKTVRFSAWLKTRAADGNGASLFIIAEVGGNIMAQGSQVRGTRDWTRHSVTLALPAQVGRLRVGTTLEGTGTVWVDDTELEVVTVREST